MLMLCLIILNIEFRCSGVVVLVGLVASCVMVVIDFVCNILVVRFSG